MKIEIPQRFNGPPSSANGGYIGGLLADRIGAASAEITLRAPPPLDVALELRSEGDGLFTLHDGDTLLAEARAVEFLVDVPPAPTFDEAAAAGALGRMRAHGNVENPYRRCFGCGIDRADGLRIVPTPVGDAGVVASDWTPSRSLADADGLVPTPVVWAALDCPAGFAWSHRLSDAPPMMTGRIAAQSPPSKAWRAAATARSMSAWPPAGTLAKAWPVAGSNTSSVAPSLASTQAPPISRRLGWARKRRVASVIGAFNVLA